jgi:hypothetical protein
MTSQMGPVVAIGFKSAGAVGMTVSQLLERLRNMPAEAVVLIESDGGLSLVGEVDFVGGQGPGAPSEVILSPSMAE